MSTLTADKATALRKPFPPESVGKLPKPYRADSQKSNCNECGGYHGLPAAHLDYVGHAATTERLLTVDPEWNWEPFALDPNGLPALDHRGNLWIRLTICGVTRIGVGDGKSLKECIGDAIRNAAMRFGVALDLWAKEDLVEFREAITQRRSGLDAIRQSVAPEPEPTPEPAAELATETGEAITATTRGRMFALFTERGITDADQQRAGMSKVLGRPVESRADLTEADGQAIIASLEGRLA